MAFSTETIGQILASGRHYVSTTAGFIGGIGLMSAAQSKGLTDAFNEIFEGINLIVHGSTSAWGILVVAFPVIGALMAKFASKSASLPNQAAAIKAAVEDPNTPVPDAAKIAVIEATSAIAHDPGEAAKDAKVALLDATASLPEVVGDIRVTDKSLEAATMSSQIKAAA